jgi:predicted nucleic acid binding AN1-type Zn finger protein
MKDYVLYGNNRVLIKVKKCIKCKAFRFKSQFEKNSNICNNYFCQKYQTNLSTNDNDKPKFNEKNKVG